MAPLTQTVLAGIPTLDTTNDAANPLEVPEAAEEAGWDAHQVWRARVHEARAARSVRPRPRDAAEGWDPLQTWRDRVQRPRGR